MSQPSLHIQPANPFVYTLTLGGGYSEALRCAVYRELPCALYVKKRNRWEMPSTAGGRSRLRVLLEQLRDTDIVVSVDPRIGALTSNGNAPRTIDKPLPFAAPTQAWRHQRMAYWFLEWARENMGSALLDCGMRTGKTRMVEEHFSGLPREQRRGIVFAPKSVVPVWAEQALRHTTPGALNVKALDRGSVARRVEEACDLIVRGCLVILGWAVLERLDLNQKQALRLALRGGTVVADEVHFAKSAGSSRSKALAYVSRMSAFRIGASGTPLAHSPLDAYGVFRFLDPGVWGTNYGRFRDEYAVMGGPNNRMVMQYKNLDDLAARMRPYTFRVTREVLDLPPSQDNDITVTLPPAAVKVYTDLRDKCVADLRSGQLIASNALAKMMRLSQVASGYLPDQLDETRVEVLHHEKWSALQELIESSAPEEPWVVFGRFHFDLDGARHAAHCAGRPYFELSGRDHQLNEWKRASAAGSGPILGAQLQAGGIGVDMTQAALCCYLSVGYSLAEYEQSRARIHGPDQTRPVAYYHILARGTVDAKIRRALSHRADVLAYVANEMLHGGNDDD